jgi:hypothetical protein
MQKKIYFLSAVDPAFAREDTMQSLKLMRVMALLYGVNDHASCH